MNKILFKSFSIKNFIADLPNLLNYNFKLLSNFFDNIFDYDNDKLNIKNIESSGTIKGNTGNFNNITIKYNNKDISLSDIIKRLENLEDNNGTNINSSFNKKINKI